MDSDRELTADDDTRELERAIVPVEPEEIEEVEGADGDDEGNKDIVRETDMLIAAPAETEEQFAPGHGRPCGLHAGWGSWCS